MTTIAHLPLRTQPLPLESSPKAESVTGNPVDLHSSASNVSAGTTKPPLGSLGGALSWPIPLDTDEQRRLRLLTLNHQHALGEQPLVMQTKGGVLEFLRYRQPLPAGAGNDPAKILEALVGSPQGQLMGKALQQSMQGIDSDSSVTDYLLAAIALQMDPESITAPARNTVAGFDLAPDTQGGRHASTVVDNLANHLSRTGRTSAALASVGAYLLLARSAPQFLIKDIPPTVKIGSQAWASLTIAAMTIEAQTPGKVPGMTFAQVMSAAEQAQRADPAISQTAQATALLDWAIANGILTKTPDDNYPPAQLESVRTHFNAQLHTRLTASEALDKGLPTREAIALAALKARFGDLGGFFQEKIFSVDQHYVAIERGTLSLLDIAMIDWLEPRPFKAHEPSSSLKSDALRGVLTLLNANPQFGVPAEFERQFSAAVKDKKAAVNTTVRHMISQLPFEDRKNFEFGKVSFFQEGSYVMDGHFNNTHGPNNPGLLVKTQRGANRQAYVIDFNKGVIETTSLYSARVKETRNANTVFTTKVFTPADAAQSLERERPLNDSPWNSFTSARSQVIASAFVEHLDLDDPVIKQQARGQTALDKANAQLSEFLLNLIPFRSAIVNFQNGQHGAGAVDLLLDVFGFLTAGTATAGKLLKVGRSLLSTAGKALQVAKVVGVAAIDVLNPVGGVGDLVKFAGSAGLFLLSKGVKAVNELRGATGSYDLLKAISKQYDAAATGSLKVAGRTVESAAVLKNGHWYSFDTNTMRPYGSPLDDFTVATQAVAGNVETARNAGRQDLSYALFGHLSVPESRIAGLTRNSQGVYVAADGHLSYIRHTDSSGKTAVYEVRQVSRTEGGGVQARVYHNNRQTELLLQHIQGDQWQRLGAPGGITLEPPLNPHWDPEMDIYLAPQSRKRPGPPQDNDAKQPRQDALPTQVKSDIGRKIDSGAEAVVYESLDGKHVYKDFGLLSSRPSGIDLDTEVNALNRYYGDGFATSIIEDGRAYIKMGKLDGVPLSKVSKHSLSADVKGLLEQTLIDMESRGIFHQDLVLQNFLYSAKDQKIYPIDIQSLPPEQLVPGSRTYKMEMRIYKMAKEEMLESFDDLLSPPV
ncbi:OspG family effector kinase [Pseudomonas sp. L1(2025)]|uniref:OspG family effector kinase n=1 Tax=Pseudomonas sp. L1(2025) TaxID=3449429 RepID=UPI003F68FEF6